MKSWYPGKRPADHILEPPPHAKQESEPLLRRKGDRILALQRSVKPAMTRETQSEGSPLEYKEREQLETAFGHDLHEVRIHRDEEAADLTASAGASALTEGRDIYFAPGAYGPGALAHEVTHILQQAQASSILPGEDITLESHANAASLAVMSGHTLEIPQVFSAPAMQRQPAPGTQSSFLKLLPTDSLTLDNFDIDRFEISGSNKQKLDEFAKRLKTTLASAPDSVVTIVGFADAPGTEPHNLALGEKRADAVRDYLVTKGLPGSLLHPTTLGEASPVVVSKGYEAKNRRVEIDIVERTFFKPPSAISPSVSSLPPSHPLPPKPIDLTFHPPSHEPTPSQQLQERLQQAVREAAQKKSKPGASPADQAGWVLRQAAREAGFSKRIQDQAESLGRKLPSIGAQAAIGQIAADKNLDANTQSALKALVDAAMQTKW